MIVRRGAGLFITIILMIVMLTGCVTARRERERPRPQHDTPSIWPVTTSGTRVTSRFGPRKDPITHQTRQHNGIDIAAPKGEPVVATADGVVAFSGRARGYGRLIRLEHRDGMETCYGHLKSDAVKKGRHVRQGQIIGKVGASGRATRPHLHYEVRVHGRPVDPARYLPRK